MSAKTKIVVLHMKELIYTGIFAVLGILLVLLLVYMFSPDKDEESRETMKYVAWSIDNLTFTAAARAGALSTHHTERSTLRNCLNA